MYGTAFIPTYYTVLRTVRYVATLANELFQGSSMNIIGEVVPGSHIVHDAFPFRMPRHGERRSPSPAFKLEAAGPLFDATVGVGTGRSRHHSPEMLGASHSIPTHPVASDSIAARSFKEVKWTALDDQALGTYPMRIQSSDYVAPSRQTTLCHKSVCSTVQYRA